jgi:hypothetical protein
MECKCGCGKEVTGVYSQTRKERGQVRGEPVIYLTGHKPYKFQPAPPKEGLNPDIPKGLCQCGCGEKTEIATGLKTQCGYSRGEPKFFILGHQPIKHGHSARGKITPEYDAYCGAKERCTNPNGSSWKNYGGRGIKFLFTNFEQFLAEVGPKPEPRRNYCIDRINNDGNYEPGNVKWSTLSESNRNRRKWKNAKPWYPRRARKKRSDALRN